MKNEKKNISFGDKVSYFYMKNIKKWMLCPACQNGKMTFDKKKSLWTCEECGYHFSEEYFLDDCVFWFCDECETYLNNQDGFVPHSDRHICRNCGYENDTTFDNIKGTCSDCGKKLPNPDATLCADCRQARRKKAKEWLLTAGKIVAGVAVVAGVSCLSGMDSDDENTDYTPLSTGDDNDIGEFIVKCANCGNSNKSSLWDEGDTIYCSLCHHRTSKDSGEDDLVECPYCHRKRDRKAYYCRYCNDSAREASSPEEFAEIDKNLKRMGY